MSQPYQQSIESLYKSVNTSIHGLTSKAVSKKLEKFGKNEIKKITHFSKLKIFLRQFTDPLVIILIIAVILSLLIPIVKNSGSLEIKETYDAIFIGIILLLNAFLGFAQEYKAEKSVELLKKLSVPKSTVYRNNKLIRIDSSELVPGDIILFSAGDRITADARIIESTNLRLDESALTGESRPVTKNSGIIKNKVGLAEQYNILFSGTTIVNGSAKALVVATGMETEIGKIATLVQSVEEVRTPLQKRLTHLGKWLGIIVITIAFIIVLAGLFNNLPLAELILIGVSLAVSAIPEGLPAVITVTLALSVNAMIKRKALIKQLKAIETLGNISVICTDKTGTLTKNEMTVSELFVNNKTFQVTGSGFSTKGDFYHNNKKISPKELKLLLEISANCNNASLPNIGDPTELALLVSAAKANIKNSLKRIKEIPFDSVKKYMITTHEVNNKKIDYIKGAPEKLLTICKYININNKIIKLTSSQKKLILDKNKKMAENALRVLAMAYKIGSKTIFVGLQGMIDKPRKEVKNAIQLCKKAGIRVIMITGDQKLTAEAIAKNIGIKGAAIEGKDLDRLSDKELKDTLKNINIFARTNPEHKVRILNILQKEKEVVAMTGDGINDAPALKKADVGVAMAIKGTDIARDASDMVLMDDNFNSIVQAISHGRTVYDNIKKFIKYELSVNFSELFLILTAILIKLPLPLLPLQILWINLATNGLPALALSVEKQEKNVMERKPRNPEESIFKDMKLYLFFGTLFLFLASLFIFTTTLDNLDKARTMALSVSVCYQLLFVFACRSNESLFKIGILSNKKLIYAVLITFLAHLAILYTKLNTVFNVTPLTINDWIKVLILASSGLVIFEISKLLKPILRHQSLLK
ncbi:MAG: cation-translocating P-type ATPase [Nanoarchaeota archaeon]|nr:cation-translocating P-type ATPase [Nanoarchaeota archaeon]